MEVPIQRHSTKKIKLYVEPFGGMFGFYHYAKTSSAVYNDINTELYQLIKEKYNNRNIVFHNEDYNNIIEQYNFDDTFFFIDPPYIGKELYYKNHNFLNKENHIELANRIKTIKGKFILCYQKNELLNQLYHGFNFYEYKNQNEIFHQNEIAITNYVTLKNNYFS